jgi:hypothetical protein
MQNNVRTQQNSPADENLPCAYCGGVAACESSCESVKSCVQYAYDVALHPAHLTFGDRLILHALGVRWMS